MVVKIIGYLLWLGLASFIQPVWAETGEYQIELIVFSQDLPNTEVFDQMGSEITWPANLYESSDYKKADTLALADTYTALSKNSAYQPLLHMGWIQKLAGELAAGPMHVRSPDGRINGYVLVQRSQAIQLTADLEYSPGADSADSSLIYRLRQSRQMNLDELNYFDHPKFGVIAKITAK